MKKVNHLRAAGWAALFVASLAAASCGERGGGPNATPTPAAVTAASPSPAASPAPVAQSPVTIYRVGSDAEGMGVLEPVETDIDTSNGAAAVLALNRMAESEGSPLPKGSRARSVRFEDDLATVDFTQEFEANFTGGDRTEALMFNAITGVLGQFPNIRKVQILVEGKKVSLGGTQDTERPLNVPPPDAVASAKTP